MNATALGDLQLSHGLSAVDTIRFTLAPKIPALPATEPRPFSRGYGPGPAEAHVPQLPATEPRPFSRGYPHWAGVWASDMLPATEPRPFSRGYLERLFFMRAACDLQLSHGLSAVDTRVIETKQCVVCSLQLSHGLSAVDTKWQRGQIREVSALQLSHGLSAVDTARV